MNNLQLDMKYLRDINEDLKADKLQLQKRMTEETRRFKEELQSTQQLASEYESRIDALTSQIQADSNFKRQYKEEYDLKYNTMYTEYKKKLEAIKSASKEREAKIKRQYKEELAKAKVNSSPAVQVQCFNPIHRKHWKRKNLTRMQHK